MRFSLKTTLITIAVVAFVIAAFVRERQATVQVRSVTSQLHEMTVASRPFTDKVFSRYDVREAMA